MARIGTFFLFLVLQSACKTSAPPLEFSAAKAPEALPVQASALPQSPEKANAPPSTCQNLQATCPAEERKLPYQCVAYRLAGKLLWSEERIYAWGSSLCQAQKSLRVEACAQKIEPTDLGDIHCSPDSTSENCPTVSKKCPSQGSPSRCVANRYKNQDIPWNERPIAWAANECLAREKMLASACQRGLNPNDLGDLTCEADPIPGTCPPSAPKCEEAAAEPTACQVSTIGDITLKKPWIALGASACEARYRLKQLACRFADNAKKLTPEQLGSMECRSLIAQP